LVREKITCKKAGRERFKRNSRNGAASSEPPYDPYRIERRLLKSSE
jgi:hypothetical protein